MAIEARFASAQVAKNSKWFSRRHQTSEAHDLNKATRSFKAKKRARQEGATERTLARAARTPKQQMAILNQRLGVAHGAAKERERLATSTASSAR